MKSRRHLVLNNPKLMEIFETIKMHMEWDNVKAWQWFETENPLFGGCQPIHLIALGREEKFIKIVTALIDESTPDPREKDWTKAAIKAVEERDLIADESRRLYGEGFLKGADHAWELGGRTAITELNGVLSEYGCFRINLRQLLHDHGVPSNPMWTEQDIVDAFRELLKKIK